MSEHSSCTLHVEGMTCASCVCFLEETLAEMPGIARAHVDLSQRTARLDGDIADLSQFIAAINARVADHGYRFASAPVTSPVSYREFLIAVPAALTFLVAFLLLQDVGLVRFIGGDRVTYGTAFFVGVVASFSTCLAVVGGLVLSFSAHAAKHAGRLRSQVLFHGGRLGGFFALGGVIGALGSVFQVGIFGASVLGLFAAGVMLALGVQLLDVFPRIASFVPVMPQRVSHWLARAKTSSHVLMPFLAGVATFFLPCGFTQSMQIATLTTGGFLAGGLTMFFFALGTFPVLALLSFGAFRIAHTSWKGVFFKAAGIVVIVLALVNAWNALVVLGIVSSS